MNCEIKETKKDKNTIQLVWYEIKSGRRYQVSRLVVAKDQIKDIHQLLGEYIKNNG